MHRKLCIPGYCFCICTQIWDYRPGLDYYTSTLLVIATPLELRGHHLPPQLVVLKLCPPLASGHGLLEIKLEDLELQLSSIPPPEDVPALHFGGRTQLQVAACMAWEAQKGLFQLYSSKLPVVLALRVLQCCWLQHASMKAVACSISLLQSCNGRKVSPGEQVLC